MVGDTGAQRLGAGAFYTPQQERNYQQAHRCPHNDQPKRACQFDIVIWASCHLHPERLNAPQRGETKDVILAVVINNVAQFFFKIQRLASAQSHAIQWLVRDGNGQPRLFAQR